MGQISFYNCEPLIKIGIIGGWLFFIFFILMLTSWIIILIS